MKTEHLQMIQDIISRMGNNSFLLRGWAVLIIGGIFTFAAENNNIKCMLFINIIILALWGLDSYYLQLERKYRRLYEDTRLKKSNYSDFNMNPSKIRISVGEAKQLCFVSCFFSKTELLFYGSFIITNILIYFFA